MSQYEQKQSLPLRFLGAIASCMLLSALFAVACRAEITIAVAAPLTGQAIFAGEQVQKGAWQAVEDLNAHGGVLGEPVRLVSVDDACDAEQAVVVAEKLVREGVSLVVGHVCSQASIPASKVYETANLVAISPASTNPLLTDNAGRNIFRLIGRDDDQGRVAAELLARDWRDARIAIVHDSEVYGEGLAEATRDHLNALGVKEAVFDSISAGDVDYSAVVGRLKAAEVDLIYFGGYPAEAGLLLREASHQGFDVQFVGGDSLTTDEFWMVAGPQSEGTLVTFMRDARTAPEAAVTVRSIRAEGFEPEGFTLHAYAAVEVWAEAVSRAGTLEGQAVATVLHDESFQTVLGEITFDAKGDAKGLPFIWYVWRAGEYLPVK